MDRHDALDELHRRHYRSLVRLVSLLLGDLETCEEVVQDAFVNTLRSWDRVQDLDKLESYLRSAALNGARKQLARRDRRRRLRLVPTGDALAADHSTLASERDMAIVEALRSLPGRQRECLALRYYLDLSEAEIASTLGISVGSVKTHAHRGLQALAARLEDHR